MSLREASVAFRILVANKPITSARWRRIGELTVEERPWGKVRFLRRDPISGALSIHEIAPDRVVMDRDVSSTDDLSQLERYAVWSQSHVEDRLRDHFAGRPNKWVESLRYKQA